MDAIPRNKGGLILKTRKQYLIISNLARDYTAYKVLPDNNVLKLNNDTKNEKV